MNTVSPDGKLPSKDALDAPYTPPDAPQLIDYTEQILAGSMLLGMDHAQRLITAADDGGTDIPKVSFDEAVQYLKGKIPVTKKEWDGLSDKLRFRAFTVAKLAEYDYKQSATLMATEMVKQLIAGNLEDGDSIAQSWEDFKNIIGNDALAIKPGYWENVYRTNTATAYTAGKLMQYQKTNPIAYELFIINDERTSKICKHLLNKSGDGLIIPIDSWFWEKYGFPPYHYQCRTGFRAIYKNQIAKDNVFPAKVSKRKLRGFKPMEGFGGNPIDKESWWRMDKNLVKRAQYYRLTSIIEKTAHELGLHNFTIDNVNGSEQIKSGIEKVKSAKPLAKEINAATILKENKHSVYFTPEVKLHKNYDAIIDGKIGEFKILTSKDIRKIAERLLESDEQGAELTCLHVTNTSGYTVNDAIKNIHNILNKGYVNESGNCIKLKNVESVYLIYGDKDVYTIKKIS